MADKVGAVFAARISGVTRFALFVTVSQNGASGIVPISTLPDDYWMHDERTQTLSGRSTRLTFGLAQPVEVRLAEAVPGNRRPGIPHPAGRAGPDHARPWHR